MSNDRVPVGILGCTGTVGQRFIQLLEAHPSFFVCAIGASDKSSGKTYAEAVSWKLSTSIPQNVKTLRITECKPIFFSNCKLIFSALDSSVAGEIEEDFAKSGFPVFSNARNHRMDDDVPILIPGVNSDHIDIIPHQQSKRGYDTGFIVTNANCSSTGLAVALKPIADAFGIEKCLVVTLQAISGAGYPGVASLDIVDNVVPYISGEEEKMETEPKKILGKVENEAFQFHPIELSAHCNRVAVIDGHTECVSIQLKKKAEPEEVERVLKEFLAENLPSAPKNFVSVLEGNDRPQPRLDREKSGGFAVSVGRIRKCKIFDIKFCLLSHNTVLGAAGGAILNAELAYKRGMIKKEIHVK